MLSQIVSMPDGFGKPGKPLSEKPKPYLKASGKMIDAKHWKSLNVMPNARKRRPAGPPDENAALRSNWINRGSLTSFEAG